MIKSATASALTVVASVVSISGNLPTDTFPEFDQQGNNLSLDNNSMPSSAVLTMTSPEEVATGAAIVGVLIAVALVAGKRLKATRPLPEILAVARTPPVEVVPFSVYIDKIHSLLTEVVNNSQMDLTAAKASIGFLEALRKLTPGMADNLESLDNAKARAADNFIDELIISLEQSNDAGFFEECSHTAARVFSFSDTERRLFAQTLTEEWKKDPVGTRAQEYLFETVTGFEKALVSVRPNILEAQKEAIKTFIESLNNEADRSNTSTDETAEVATKTIQCETIREKIEAAGQNYDLLKSTPLREQTNIARWLEQPEFAGLANASVNHAITGIALLNAHLLREISVPATGLIEVENAVAVQVTRVPPIS